MRRFILVFLLMLTSAIALADDEYAYREVIAPDEVYSVDVGAPLIATKPSNRAEMLYKIEYLNSNSGDMVTQLAFKGYNPGEAFTRHIVVWMSNTLSRRIEDTYSETLTKVFEGDCTIASGGSADERIPLLTIPLEHPFVYDGYSIRVIIESTGDPVAQDICFERYQYRWYCCHSTAEETGGEWSEPEYTYFPITTLTIATPVVNMTGTVCNQDNIPIPGATVQMKSTDWPTPIIYSGESDENGNYSIRIEDGNKSYLATVSAPGCATYTETYWGSTANQVSIRNFTLYDAVEYKAERRATIMMPVTPDASLGKYFRMARTEDMQLIFEREPSPQANVPYVIFPYEDFSVDLKPLDLTMEAGKTSISNVDFVGSYINYDFPTTDNQELIFLDETPDCGFAYYYSELWGQWFVGGGRIGALRACIVEDGWYGNEVVFHDDTSGITTAENDAIDGAVVYDLQGRRLIVTPQNGIYIAKGKKIVVK